MSRTAARASSQARDAAERAGIEIRYYNIIYDLVDDIKLPAVPWRTAVLKLVPSSSRDRLMTVRKDMVVTVVVVSK